MPYPFDKQPITESTYIFDSESASEMARLTHQGQLLTQAMGGPLAGIDRSDTAQWQQVLDIGCGPGDWVLDVAVELAAVEVAGIDISRLMVDYANTRARSQHLVNASFEVMDIRNPLEFPDETFDMVNVRYLFAVLRRDEWVPFLQECRRILRPGGLLRLTEPINLGLTSSPALGQLNTWFFQVLSVTVIAFPSMGPLAWPINFRACCVRRAARVFSKLVIAWIFQGIPTPGPLFIAILR